MTRKILFFILFTVGLNLQAQDHGMLIRTTIDASAGWNHHSGRHTIIIGQNQITHYTNPTNKPVVKFDFFYVNDNPSEIKAQSSTAGNINGDCNTPPEDLKKTYDIYSFNKDNYTRGLYFGCFAESEIMSIHIPKRVIKDGKDSGEICYKDIVTLRNGWNWKYCFEGGIWRDFPAQYQNQNSISFLITDLLGYNTTSKNIIFQAGYSTFFTNPVTYDIVGCSPELDGNPTTSRTKCNDDPSGSVTLKFKSELKTGERFLFNLLLNGTQIINSAFAQKSEIINMSYTWKNIKEGYYTIKYQSQSLTDNNTIVGNSGLYTAGFTISGPAPLKFTTTAIQPLCNTDKGTIQITASGGTPPYFYILDNEPYNQKHVFTSPYSITGLSEGDHSVKIVDSNDCVEK